MNEYMDVWMSEYMNEWMCEWMNIWMNEYMDVWMSEYMKEWIHEWMNEYMNEWMNEYMNECVNEWMNVSKINTWINDWMCEWMNTWMNECVNEWFFTAGDSSCPTAQTIFPFHHLCVARDMCKLGCANGTTYRHCNWEAAVAWTGSLWYPTRGDAHCCRIHLDYGTCWVDSGARPRDTALCHLNPTCGRKHEN
jgi:hypothetical protein